MDYKVIEKFLLHQRSIQADVIHPDQKYTVLGRSIFDNMDLVQDHLKLTHRDGLSFTFLSLDQNF